MPRIQIITGIANITAQLTALIRAHGVVGFAFAPKFATLLALFAQCFSTLHTFFVTPTPLPTRPTGAGTTLTPALLGGNQRADGEEKKEKKTLAVHDLNSNRSGLWHKGCRLKNSPSFVMICNAKHHSCAQAVTFAVHFLHEQDARLP